MKMGGRRQWRKEVKKKVRRKTRASATFIDLGPTGGFGTNFAAKTSAQEWHRKQQKKIARTGAKGKMDNSPRNLTLLAHNWTAMVWKSKKTRVSGWVGA